MQEARALASPNVSKRFSIRRKLGSGAFGNVYEAYDHERDMVVALKTLLQIDAVSLYRFKREFRDLADIAHPNLVRLHELFCIDERWFFTMDLIEGVNFLTWARPGLDPSLASTLGRSEVVEKAAPSSRRLRAEAAEQGVRRQNLCAALGQLAVGVEALHAAGKMHRDLKPLNVLVTPRGRVVVLDFGLVADASIESSGAPHAPEVVGTPAYMSPEQAAARAIGFASDWYSVGVMLYEALTGNLPFEGHPLQILRAKQAGPPEDARALVAPELGELAGLAMRLLACDPQKRADGAAILAAVGDGRTAREPGRAATALRPIAEHFVGREEPFAALEAAFRGIVQGRCSLARVRGRSGMGKTALVRTFLERLRRDGQAAVLEGRCHELESVPYKALDSLVDMLTRHLLELQGGEAAALLAGLDAAPLLRMFPVLRQAVGPEGDGVAAEAAADPQEQRSRAFGALRALLGRLAERRLLVLWIDDLQWGDADSAAFLADLLLPPDPPRVLLIASYRSEDVEGSEFLRVFLSPRKGLAETVEGAEIRVDPLDAAEATHLAALLLEEQGDSAAGDAARIARESGGSPFFIQELVQHVVAGERISDVGGGEGGLRLDTVLWDRIRRLSAPAQRLLEVVSLAGRAVELGTARRAAGLVDEVREALDELRFGRLVRTKGLRAGDLVEPFHDRVRETVTSHLDAAARREHHGHLASALEASGHADPEALAMHFRGAGEIERAWVYAVLAADRMADALAFRRAAALYGVALELCPERDALALRTKLGEALANAGRGVEAARAFLEAASGATPDDALDLRRRAAEQLLRVGHVDEGLDLVAEALAGAGMRLPRSPLRALALLVLRRAWLRVRGTGWRGRYGHDTAELRRIDVGWALAVGLSNSDAIRGAEIQTRTLLRALEAGEPSRIARGLALEACFVATAGVRNARRAARLLAASQTLAQRLENPYALGWSVLASDGVAYFEGRWKRAFDLADQAHEALSRCAGAAWESATARHYAIWALGWLGEIGEMSRRVRLHLKEALERGDQYSATDMRIFLSNVAWLADDDVHGARAACDEAMRGWSRRGFHAQHYYGLYASAQIDLYAGEAGAALARLEQGWPLLRRSMLTRVQTVLLEWLHLRARSALAAAEQAPAAGGEVLVASAERDARRIGRQHAPCAAPLAALVLAAVELRRGREARAVEHLRAASDGFQGADMALHAAVARMRLGALVGGEQGRALVEDAADWMTGRAIRDPVRFAQMIAPGFARARRALPAASDASRTSP